MKNKIDYCLVQWLNRELLPKNYSVGHLSAPPRLLVTIKQNEHQTTI